MTGCGGVGATGDPNTQSRSSSSTVRQTMELSTALAQLILQAQTRLLLAACTGRQAFDGTQQGLVARPFKMSRFVSGARSSGDSPVLICLKY